MKPNYKIIFDNLKDGDCLAFYRKAWYLQIIPFFTREQKGEEAPQHVSRCYEVVRGLNTVSFKLSEQTFHGGQYRDVDIYKIGDKYFCEDDYFRKQDKIALLSLKKPLTPKQIERGIEDAKAQEDKVYGYSRLFFASETLDRLLPKSIKRRLYYFINKDEDKRLCSNHIQFNLLATGNSVDMGEVYSPLEITKLPDFNVIV